MNANAAHSVKFIENHYTLWSFMQIHMHLCMYVCMHSFYALFTTINFLFPPPHIRDVTDFVISADTIDFTPPNPHTPPLLSTSPSPQHSPLLPASNR